MSSMPPKDQLHQAIERLDVAILETEHPGLLEAIEALIAILQFIIPGFVAPSHEQLLAMTDSELLAYAESLQSAATEDYNDMGDGG